MKESQKLISSEFIFTCFFACLEFRSGKAPILLATDVASRGLGKYWRLIFFVISQTTAKVCLMQVEG